MADLPLVVRCGVALIAAGGLLELVYHGVPGTAARVEVMGPVGHGVMLAGMVVAMAGVFRVGLTQHRR